MVKKKFKKGAASFYVVAFSTLILVVIAASFATVVISEVIRGSNDDLSQSAYDAALAGVEDARLAYANYRRCLLKDTVATEPNGDGSLTCAEIVWIVDNSDSCDMVGLATGHISEKDWYVGGGLNGEFSGETMVSDTTSTKGDGVESNLNQAYTCTKINTKPIDYRANLTSSASSRLVKVEFEDPSVVNSIDSVKLSWYDVRKGEKLYFGNFSNSRVVFQPVMQSATVTPPTISLQLIQTGLSFDLSSFESSVGNSTNNSTNRATMYFVPTDNYMAASNNKKAELDNSVRNGNASEVTYSGIWYGSENIVYEDQVVKTNDHYNKNLPYLTYCNPNTDSGFYCEATIKLPKPVGGERNKDTFMFLVSLPYGEPDTNFALEFLINGETQQMKGTQIEVDSTGRANDLYRRVETRFETIDTSFSYIVEAIHLFGDSDASSNSIDKNMTVTKQW